MGALTQEEKDAIRDAGVAKWWEDWFEADYSWEGLSKFPWQGWKVVTSKTAYDKYIKTYGLPSGCPNKACQVVPTDFDGLPEGTKTRPATLQDYWRDQEAKLEGQVGGKRYTIAHLPSQYPDGTESWKAGIDHENWKVLSALVTARLERGVKTDLIIDFLGDDQITGIDGRANFQGCILPALPPQISQTTPPRQDSKPSNEASDNKMALHLTLQKSAIVQAQKFIGTIFGSPTSFHQTLFSGGDARFSDAQFSGGYANFSQANFKIGFTFISARFEKRALFQDTIFPPPAGSKNAFSTSEFLGLVDFSRKASSDKRFPYNAFANARVKDDIVLPDHGPEKAQEGFDLALKSLSDTCADKDEEETGAHFIALEQGCIRLKRAMEDASDKNRAQRYFKFELLARQKRPSTPPIVKIFTWLYGATADYGASMKRPVCWLLGIWIFFAFIYGPNAWAIGVKPDTIWGYFWGPLEFSMTHVFRPLFIWSSTIPNADVSWAGKYREQLADGGWFAIKIIATIQSFISTTLLFLFGLATKRKFQIG